MKKMTRVIVKAVAALALAVSPMFFASAEDIPFEVKFILDNKVLDESDKTSNSRDYCNKICTWQIKDLISLKYC